MALLSLVMCTPSFADFMHGHAQDFTGSEVAFVALQQTTGNDRDWDFSLLDPHDDWAPVGQGNYSGDGDPVYWTLTYDGTDTLTFGWGNDPDKLDDSIAYLIGDIDFSYLTVTAGSPGRGTHPAMLDKLVLQTDLGILAQAPRWNDNKGDYSYTFTYDGLPTFGAFTLTGLTSSSSIHDRNDRGGPDFVAIYGGGPTVVAEPATALLLLFGLLSFVSKRIRQEHLRRLLPAALRPSPKPPSALVASASFMNK